VAMAATKCYALRIRNIFYVDAAAAAAGQPSIQTHEKNNG